MQRLTQWHRHDVFDTGSARQVVADIGHDFGIAPAALTDQVRQCALLVSSRLHNAGLVCLTCALTYLALATLALACHVVAVNGWLLQSQQKGESGALDIAAALQLESSLSDDARLLIHELQSARQRQRELERRVSELESDQTIAKERVSLYAELTLQLKRELVNERLAHLQSKKDAAAVAARAAKTNLQQRRGSNEEKPLAQRRVSDNLDTAAAADDDPWSSPGKSPGGTSAGASTNLLAFSSFYQTARPLGADDEPPSPTSSTGGSGLHALRGSMMDQFLPSSLLDSPQLTPLASSRASNKSFSHHDTDEGDSSRLAFVSDLTKSLDASFSLLDPPCLQCKQLPITECAPCGHQLCASCDANMTACLERTCPRCSAPVTSVKDLATGCPRDGDNQVAHIVEAAAAATSETKESGTASPRGTRASDSSRAVSSVTLALLAELFDSIPVDQLETALKDANGHAPLAIEKILHSHPSFHPRGTSGSASGGSAAQSPAPPGHKSSLPRASMGGSSQSGAAASASASSNWKTEMCMYYLQGKCNKTRRTCSFAHGESDLVRPSSAKHAASVGFKTRMCPLFVEGICPKSRRDCPLAHGENDLRDGLAALASSAALPAAAPRLQSYKTELCYYYLKGCCNYTKDECRFAHGESDLRTVESNTLEWTAKLVGATEFTPSGGGSLPTGGAGSDKQLQHQHQYQQQFQPQFAPPQPQQPPPSQQLQPHTPAFTPAHQMPMQHAMPHHQVAYAQYQHMPPPPHMAMQHSHHHQTQPGMFHGNQPGHQFRYGGGGGGSSSGMDASKRSARPPPQPRRDSASWSSGYDPSGGQDF